jgi:hypothetical protein
VPAPVLETGEAVEWQCPAARQIGTFQTGGGRLFLTSARLIHQPNRLNRRPLAQPWSTQRATISDLSVRPRQLILGLRNRLRVELVDGTVQLFVVNNLDKVLADLRIRLAQPPSMRS